MIGFDSMASHCLLMGRKEVTTLMYVYIYIFYPTNAKFN